MTIYTLSYHSRNRIDDITPDPLVEIDKLLEVARARNGAAGVTGALLFNEGRFTQVLEGKESSVKEIFESIKLDPRHAEVTLLSTQTSLSRRFESWSMAFVGATPAAQTYYKDFVRRPDFNWKKVDQDKLCQLMLDMISVDQRSHIT